MIRTVTLPTFPTALSAVCLGTARFGHEYDDAKSFELMDYYYAMGGRFLDTANVYGRWSKDGLNHSEITVGKWLKERSITDMIVTSKCVHYAPGHNNISRVNREEAMRDIESSRQALGMDEIPIYLTHRDNPEVDVRIIVDFMAEMVEKGWVKRFGFSNYTADRVKTAIEYMGDSWREMFVGVSNEWSLHLEATAAEKGGKQPSGDGIVTTDIELWKMHREMNVPLIPFSAAAHGFYAKVKDVDSLPQNEQEIYSALKKESENNGVSVNSASVAYLLNSGVSAIPIVAVSKVEQLKEFEEIAGFNSDLSYISPFAKM